MSSNADHNYEMIKFVRRGYRRGQVPVNVRGLQKIGRSADA